MFSKIIFIVYYVALEFASAASTYDQSQTGNLNVQIDLKDLQIISLSKSNKEEYVDYDYAYDYSEMTIKPQNGTTTRKPLNVSSTSADVLSDNTTTSSAPTAYIETTTKAINNYTEAPVSVVGENKVPVVTEYIKNITEATVKVAEITMLPVVTTVKSVDLKMKNDTKKSDTITPAPAPANGTTNCNRGFVYCESQQQTKPLSILEMLSQKFKRRENRKTQEKKD